MSAKFLFNESFSDIVFIIGEKKIFANKSVLSEGSEVFHKQFYGSVPQTDKEIIVLDINEECFREVLRFLYTSQAEITGTNVNGILLAADKYMIKELMNQCFNYMEANLSTRTVFKVIETSKLVINSDEIMESCLDFIEEKTNQFFENEEFKNLTKNDLKVILRKSRLNLKEINLFDGVLKWSEYQCEIGDIEKTNLNIRIVLDDLFYLLRFPTMALTDYSKCISKEDLFTANEISSFNLYRSKNVKNDLKFSCKPRRFVTSNYQMFEFYENSSKPEYHTYPSPIFFRVDNSIDILGCHYTWTDGNFNQLEIKWFCNGSAVELFTLNKLQPIQKIVSFFKKPFQIKPNNVYELQINLKKNDQLFSGGTSGISPNTIFTIKGVTFEMIKIASTNLFISFIC